MNGRINKLASEIGKTREKIAELSLKLKDLERQKTELENSEYVAIIRELNMTPTELATFLKRHTYGGNTATAARQAQPAGAAKPDSSKEAADEKE
jgi:hypothetical protein